MIHLFREIWDGPRTGVERAGEFGANAAYSVHDIPDVLPRILYKASTIYYTEVYSDVSLSEVLQGLYEVSVGEVSAMCSLTCWFG